ncbi:hypothetical protein I302_103163 [Kwoniella bestiolae CBS 10118]|uniref:N-acetyltransferase domain-containing protein n=1 Tax=Kwoniella bestiolae CBS 10118 TaxID=1296100 RepID=A0A1B9G7N1_9TREE|nr:hypothetical protein I302_01861 [Kwoniella bestiolae CBS 10118]OCF27026.1 hypothetical protein I302_01861 [Kwoniella bestiolae CBS 10118]
MREIPAHSIRIAETPEDVARCMQIRKEVFIDEQGYDIKVETNDDDHRSTHFLLVLSDNEEPVGTIRLINENNQLGRFAILKQYRGMGLGIPLIQALHDYVRGKGGKEVWCQSQAGDPTKGGADATGFYKRLGYVDRGERYMKEGTVHQDMVYTLQT